MRGGAQQVCYELFEGLKARGDCDVTLLASTDGRYPALFKSGAVITGFDGKPISKEHGGPARVIVPKLYAWKGAKFVRSIEFRAADKLGFWEVRGYSNTADPWTDDRFA